jgi:hypothetical protein
MRTYRVVPDPKNHADHRATLPGGHPIKDLGLPLGETQGTQSAGMTILKIEIDRG